MKKASEIKAPVEFIHYKAKNDINGNPRRLFLLIWGEQMPYNKCVVDDAYAGENWIKARQDAGLETSGGRAIHVPVAEYRKMLKQYPEYENA